MSTPNITWEQIRKQFTAVDIQHMKDITGGAMDLSDCESVHKWAQEIYIRVTATEDPMPPRGFPRWTQEQMDNFKIWMEAGAQCPKA
jgi:hypothetical protein